MKTLRMAVMLLLLAFAAQAAFAQSESNCKIKGFLAKDGKKLYLVPGHKLYDKIQVNTESGEQWFCTAEEAESAGFLFVPDPQKPQLRPVAASTPKLAPVAAQSAEPTPKPQPTEQTMTEQQPPAEMPQEQQSSVETPQEQSSVEAPQEQQQAETPAQAEPQSGEMEHPMETLPPISPAQGIMMLMGVLMPFLIFAGALALIMIIASWKIFTKAGKPGWASLVPFYSNIVLLEIAGMPLWWFLLEFVIFPIVWFINCLKLAERFGKGAGYGLGLFFLPFIFFPMLAFGSAEYNG